MQRSSVVFLCLLLIVSPVSPANGQSEGDVLVIEDDREDVAVEPLGIATNAPPISPASHIDIIAVSIGAETPTTLDVAIQTRGWETGGTAVDAGSLSGFTCTLHWTYNAADSGYVFSVRFHGSYSKTDEAFTLNSQLSLKENPDDFFAWATTLRGHTSEYDVESSTFSATIQKTHIPILPADRLPAAGDTLLPLVADCFSDTGGYVLHRDQADLGGHSFGFEEAGNDQRLHADFQPPRPPVQDPREWWFPRESGFPGPVAAGEPTPVSFYLFNTDDIKRLVKLELVSELPSGWNVTHPPSVMVRSEEFRVVQFLVTSPATAAIGDRLDLTIEVTLAGDDAAWQSSRTFEVSPVLSPEQNTYNLFGRSFYDPPFEQLYAFWEFRMSLREDLPEHPREPIRPLVEGRFWGSTDPVVLPVRLEPEPAVLTLAVDGIEGSGLHLSLYFHGPHGHLYQFEERLNPGVHEFELPARFDDPLAVWHGSNFWFDGRVDQATPALQAELDLTASSFTLPVSSVPVTANDGRFVPRLTLASEEDDTTYVNPGKRYSFGLILANDGAEDDELHLSLDPGNATGWDARLLPGSKFRVPAGESTPLSVEVVAPEGAKEGDTLEVRITAASNNDPKAIVNLTVRAIVTAELQIEEKAYEAAQDQLPPMEEETEDSPLMFLPIFLALIAVVGILRRR